MAMSTSDRIRRHVQFDESGCWLWTASRFRDGYGKIRQLDGSWLAHRAAYEEFRGRVGSGLQLDHLCRVRRCVNPWHLEEVTLRENVLRGVSGSAFNATKTSCSKGHPFDDRNTRILVGRNGLPARACRKCNAEAVRRYKARCHAEAQS